MKYPSKLLAALSISLLLILGACGSGSDDTGSTGDTESQSGGDQSEGDDQANDPQGAAQILADADCRQYVNAFSSFGNSTPGTDNVQSLQDVAGFFEEVADSVPNEISDDFKKVAGAYRTFADAMSGLDLTNPSAGQFNPDSLAGLEQASREFDAPEFQQAVENIETFLEENCVAN